MASNNSTFKIPDEKRLDIKQFIQSKVIRYWYLYLTSLAVALMAGYFYNWYATPVYNATATLLIKDEKRVNPTQDLLTQLSSLDHTGGIDNEVELIRSRTMIARTLRKLDFDITYLMEGNIKISEQYRQSPVKLIIDSFPFRSYENSIHIEILDDKKYELIFDNRNSGESVSEVYAFNQPVQNVIGKFTLEKTDKFRTAEYLQPDFEKRKFILIAHHFDNLVDRYTKNLNITFVSKKATILELSLKDRVPQKAGDFLNTLMDVYIQSGVENKNEIASNSLKFIDDQLQLVSEDLKSSEQDLESYKTEKGITDLGTEAQAFLESVKIYDEKISSIDIQNSFLQYLEGYIMEDKELEKISPASIGIADPLLTKLITQLADLQNLRKSQLNSTKPDNPIIMTLEIQIQNTREDLLENVRSIRNGLMASKQEAEIQLSRIRDKIRTVPRTQRELVGMQRQALIREGLYNYLLQKRAETAIMLASTISDNRIVNSARASKKPVRPVPSQTYTFAILLGLMIPAFFIYGREFLNDKITGLQELKGMTKVPVIGVVAFSENGGKLLAAEKPESMISESFRLIRTNLQYITTSSEKTRILVTSTVSSEGKSFCAANLAAVYALSGKKVILVHGDLRKPKKSSEFGLKTDAGISNFLIGTSDLESILQPHPSVENLSIVLSGPKPPNPSELMLHKRMGDFFSELENIFDVIIVDSPPIGLVSDGMLLNKYTDATIFIVRQNVTNKQSIDYLNSLSESGKMTRLSIIFNAVKNKQGKNNGHKYGYGYGYGYGHGYYDEDRS